MSRIVCLSVEKKYIYILWLFKSDTERKENVKAEEEDKDVDGEEKWIQGIDQ